MKRVLVIYLLFFSIPAIGQNSSVGTLDPADSSSIEVKSYVYEGHQWLSDQLVIFSNEVDSFFGEKESMLERNGTRVRFYNVSRMEKNLDPTQEVYFKVDLKLPNLQKRLQFNLEKNGDTEEGEFLESDKRVTQDERFQNDDSIRAGFSYFLNDFKKYNLKFSTGLNLSTKVSPYVKFKINRDFKIKEGTLSFLSLSYWDNNEDLTENIRLNYSIELSEDFTFQLINDAKWFNTTKETLVTQGPTLHQRISDRRDLYYNFRFNSSSKPQYELDSYYTSLTYRQRIAKHWLFYELSPYLKFPRSNNYKKIEGVLFTLKAIVGSL